MKNLFLMLVVGTLISSCQQNQERGYLKTITLISEGKVEVKPDIALVPLYIQVVNKDVRKVKADLQNEMNLVEELLIKLDIASNDVETTSINQSKESKWERGKYIFVGYSASVTMNVKVSDLKKISKLYTVLLNRKNVEMRGLVYSHSNPDSLQNVSYINALEKANGLADALIMTSSFC